MTDSGSSSASEAYERAAAVFAAAIERAPGERAAFVEVACAGDALLRAAVVALLAAHVEDDGFLSAPAPALFAGLLGEEPGALREGARVGPYRVVRELGHGGMGSVYLAERADGQFEQRVALKVVRAPFAGGLMHERFLRERRILARLEHPGIARLLDGGVLGDGRPFLVMEYVDGRPLDRHCDERRLTIDHRLFLFEQVCAAVAYAHRNLVIHRDLKPANILVSGDGAVKLLDFGVARLMETGDDENGEGVTGMGLRLLTPEYASPEQFLGEPVSTASDVYSLGVLLYELLSGIRPHRVAGATPVQIRRAALEGNPVSPSHALKGPGGDAALAAARARGTTPSALRRRLNGDLDDIVLTAMRREPEARYASIDALRADVRRHLAGLPVAARPATLRYRATKFVARNRIVVGAAALVLVAIAAGVAATIAQSRATAREALRAAQIREFLVEVFTISDPDGARGDAVTARELLDRGAERVATDLADQPMLRADMMAVLGTVYQRLGLFPEARAQFEEALRLRRDGSAPASELAASLTDLAALLVALDETDVAESLIREALDLFRSIDGPRSSEVASALLDLAAVHRTRGEYAEAEPLYREALAIHREAEDPESVADALNGLGILLTATGDADGARAALVEAVEIRRRVQGDRHTETARTLCNLGFALGDAYAFDEAIAAFEECLEIRRGILEPDHPDIAMTLNNLGTVHQKLERVDEAERLFTEALEIRRRRFGENHTLVAGSLNNLAIIAYQRGDHAGAATRFAEILEVWRALVGDDHPNTITTANNLGMTLQAAGELAGSETALRAALEGRRRVLGDAHPDVAETQANLAGTVERRGRLAEAEAMMREAIAGLEAAFPDGNSRTAAGHSNLGRMLVDQSRFEEALLHLQLAVRQRAEALGEDHFRTAESRLLLGRSLLGLDRPGEAIPVLRRAHADLVEANGPDHARSREAAAALAAASRGTG